MDAKVYNLSWNRTSFLSKLTLFFRSIKLERRKIKDDDSYVKADGYSALSSTYYSIASTARAQIRGFSKDWPFLFVIGWSAWWLITWAPLGAWCYWRMLPLSDRVVELIGYEGMSADQCDVRQSILRQRGKYTEAEECIIVGLVKHSQTQKAHTRGLLQLGMVDVLWKKEDSRILDMRLNIAIGAAQKVEESEPLQAARIYCKCGYLLEQIGSGNNLVKAARCYKKADKLIKKTGAQDQKLKLEK